MDVHRESSNIKVIDNGIKNKFQWKWLENKDTNGNYLSDYFRKINVAGKAWCIVCNHIITYGSSGMKALMKHGNLDAHKTSSKIKNENQTLSAAFQRADAVQSGEAFCTISLN